MTRADELRAYLIHHGWAEEPGGEAGAMFTLGTHRIAVPRDDSDLAAITGVVERIARAESRSADEVIAEVIGEHAYPAGLSVEGMIASAEAKMLDHGVMIQYVLGGARPEERPFAYTVGLTAFDHPELLVVSLDPETAGEVLNPIAELVRLGRRFSPGDVLEGIVAGGYRLVIAGPVAESREGGLCPIGMARAMFPETDVPLAYQVVYPDAGYRFPWDAGYNITVPLLAPAPQHLNEGPDS